MLTRRSVPDDRLNARGSQRFTQGAQIPEASNMPWPTRCTAAVFSRWVGESARASVS